MAVLGHGFGYQYPKENAPLYDEIARKGLWSRNFLMRRSPTRRIFRSATGLSQDFPREFWWSRPDIGPAPRLRRAMPPNRAEMFLSFREASSARKASAATVLLRKARGSWKRRMRFWKNTDYGSKRIPAASADP